MCFLLILFEQFFYIIRFPGALEPNTEGRFLSWFPWDSYLSEENDNGVISYCDVIQCCWLFGFGSSLDHVMFLFLDDGSDRPTHRQIKINAWEIWQQTLIFNIHINGSYCDKCIISSAILYSSKQFYIIHLSSTVSIKSGYEHWVWFIRH